MKIDPMVTTMAPVGVALSADLLGKHLRAARINKGVTQEEAGEATGMSRLAVLQVEAGTRAISSLELVQLARFYGRQIEEFFGEDGAEEDPLIMLGRIVASASQEWSEQIKPFLEQLREAVSLSLCLDEYAASLPPLYQFGEPLSYKEAIEQGREMASLERKRLGLGSTCINDVAALISCQSIWTAAVPFPQDISGVFLRHAQYGLAVLINSDHARARRRFSYSHEYAHALVDREKKPAPTSRQNANELVEKRANAFASEFLMPETGVRESLERMQKGAASREYSLLYDVANDEVLSHETRHDAAAQRITTSEIAILAHDFKVSYEVAVYRLSDIGVLKRSYLEQLLESEQRSNGTKLILHLNLYNGDEHDGEEQPHLQRQLILLAIEAHRREKISDSRFCRICEDIAGYDAQKAKELLLIARSTF